MSDAFNSGLGRRAVSQMQHRESAPRVSGAGTLFSLLGAGAAQQVLDDDGFLEEGVRPVEGAHGEALGGHHPFPVYMPEKPLSLTNEEIRRIDHEEQVRHELNKLGIEQGDA